MTKSREDIIREALGPGEQRLSEERRREALAALHALSAEREELSERVRNERAQIARLRRVEQAARDLLDASGGRRSATSVLTAMATLRAALKEQG
ncbi:MAG TPA: hypothetical protein VF029_00405 [Actinomycetota bacterium]